MKKTLPALLGTLLLAAAARAVAADPPADPAAVPQDPPELTDLLDRLAARAVMYRNYALGFTCRESIVRSSYDPEKGSFKKRQREVYDYLFERSEKTGRLGEVRELIEENGHPTRRSTRELELEIPPAYAWSQIFAQENRGKFHFKLAGRVLKGYRLLVQMDFTGWAAEPGTGDIGGWSGRASVDSGTLNLAEILAEPSGQSARVEAEKLKYQRAFAIMGVPLAGRPKSRTLSVTFGFENEGLTYPTEATILKNVYVRTAEMGLEEKMVLRYTTYRFFKVGATPEEARPSPSADPNSDPNAPPARADPNAPAAAGPNEQASGADPNARPDPRQEAGTGGGPSGMYGL